MPRPNTGESKEDFIKRYMGSEEAKKAYPDEKQRYAVALGVWKGKHKEMASMNFNYNVAIEEMGMVDNDFIIAGTAINATTTSNNHKFLPEVLEESAKTLIGVPLLVDHENKVENIKGRVFYAGYDAPNQRIPFRAKVMDPTIKSMIKDGRLNSVSVGAMVDPKNIEEDADGCLIPHNIVFKELSLVAVPADQGATFNIAMNQAYKSFKDDTHYETDEPDSEDSETEKQANDIQETDNLTIERRKNMEEQKTETVEEKKEIVEDKSAELNAMKEANEKLMAELKAIKEAKEKVELIEKIRAEEKAKLMAEIKSKSNDVEEVDEEVGYKILQGVGSLKGGAFTMIRNKY